MLGPLVLVIGVPHAVHEVHGLRAPLESRPDGIGLLQVESHEVVAGLAATRRLDVACATDDAGARACKDGHQVRADETGRAGDQDTRTGPGRALAPRALL